MCLLTVTCEMKKWHFRKLQSFLSWAPCAPVHSCESRSRASSVLEFLRPPPHPSYRHSIWGHHFQSHFIAKKNQGWQLRMTQKTKEPEMIEQDPTSSWFDSRPCRFPQYNVHKYRKSSFVGAWQNHPPSNLLRFQRECFPSYFPSLIHVEPSAQATCEQ